MGLYIACLFCAITLGKHLQAPRGRVLALLVIFPVVGLIALLLLMRQATKELKAAGVSVSLFGISLPEAG